MQSDNRRAFLGQLAALSAIASTTGCAHAAGLASTLPPVVNGASPDPWVPRVERAKHRAVFDSPAIDSGGALNHAFIYMDGYHKTFGVADEAFAVVVVVRHAAMSMVFGSALWQRYGIGASLKLNDSATGKPIEHNPYELMSAEAVVANEGIESGIVNLQRRGVIVLACDLALSAASRQIARRLNRDAAEVGVEVRAGLIPGVTVAPSGIYALTRAQEAGCVFVKST